MTVGICYGLPVTTYGRHVGVYLEATPPPAPPNRTPFCPAGCAGPQWVNRNVLSPSSRARASRGRLALADPSG